MKIEFLSDLEKIFEFLLRETAPERMASIVYEEIKDLYESSALQRDIENFIAYFNVILSAKRIPRVMKFDTGLVRAFVERTYVSQSDSVIEYRAWRMYEFMADHVADGTNVTQKCLDDLTLELELMKTPTIQKILAKARIATILKWLQGPLRNQLSPGFQDSIVFLATIYGQHRKSLAVNVDWQPLEVSAEDAETLVSEYRVLEIAIIEALEAIRQALRANPDLSRYDEQFQIVLTSLDNLAKMEDAGTLDSFDSLKDRLIISTALIYVQDDYVQKDSELKQLIQLFVSLYVKYRDKPHKKPPERA